MTEQDYQESCDNEKNATDVCNSLMLNPPYPLQCSDRQASDKEMADVYQSDADPANRWNFVDTTAIADLARASDFFTSSSVSSNFKNPSDIFDAVASILVEDSIVRGRALHGDEAKESTPTMQDSLNRGRSHNLPPPAPPPAFTPNYGISFVDIDWLKEHEQIVSEERVQKLHDAIVEWNEYRLPLLVDSQSGAILDGHHRYAVGRIMGLSKLPALLVDYLNDDSVSVDVWPDCAGLDSLTKEDVVKMSLSDEVYPPKTSKHTIHSSFLRNATPVNVPLWKLR
jgi:hypothetical protein